MSRIHWNRVDALVLVLGIVGLFVGGLVSGCGGDNTPEECDPGMHKDENGECVPHELCEADSCNNHGVCNDQVVPGRHPTGQAHS